MDDISVFYYPYGSFDQQTSWLGAAAAFFDRLIMLDPEKASGGIVGAEAVAKDVALLESKGLLERLAPEDILGKYEEPIATEIKADMADPEFVAFCERSGRASHWTLALAKVPKSLRQDQHHQPLDQSMQRLLTSSGIGYVERWLGDGQARGTGGNTIEYRYADFPLSLGESIMVNHTLFASLVDGRGTPLTDETFHRQVLELKLRRASQIPQVRQVLEERMKRRKLKRNALVTAAMTDIDLDLPVVSPKLPLEEVLRYREDHAADLAAARQELALLARRARSEPLTEDLEREIETQLVPSLHDKLADAGKARDAWVRSRGRRFRGASSVAIGAAAAVLSVVAVPVTPIALATASLSFATGTILPGWSFWEDWRAGRQSEVENGLHYLLRIPGGRT